jgi:hypothetical protein
MYGCSFPVPGTRAGGPRSPERSQSPEESVIDARSDWPSAWVLPIGIRHCHGTVLRLLDGLNVRRLHVNGRVRMVVFGLGVRVAYCKAAQSWQDYFVAKNNPAIPSLGECGLVLRCTASEKSCRG